MQLDHKIRGLGIRMICAGFRIYNTGSMNPSVTQSPLRQEPSYRVFEQVINK